MKALSAGVPRPWATSRRELLLAAAAGAVGTLAGGAAPRVGAAAEPASPTEPVPRHLRGKERAMATGAFSPSRLERLHAGMAGYAARGEVPGIVTSVSRRGETHVDAVGVLAVNGAPVQRDSLFRISSMTKPVTAVAALMLVEECKLRLDDPVDGLLPELANRRVLKRIDGPLDETVPAQRAITLRDLLTFRMGFGQLVAPPDAYPILKRATELKIGMGPPMPDALPAPDEWLRRLGSLPLMRQPGEAWIYNTGADVLGVLISRASGQTFETFLEQRIFGPLGMRDTGFYVPAAKLPRFSTVYGTNFTPGGPVGVYDPARGGQWSRPPAFPSGAGGLVSTAEDYLAFATMLLNGGVHGRERLLARPTVELMATNQLTQEQRDSAGIILGENRSWGLGVSVVMRRDGLADSIGRFGWDGGLGSSAYMDPREQMTGVLMTNQAWNSPLGMNVTRDFWTLAYQAFDDERR